MAEYIEKQELKNYLDCEIDFGGIDNRLMVLSKIDEVPTADVVEREKVKQAIEEIESINEVVHDGINHYYKDCAETKKEVLEILKRNIGE